MFIFQKIERGSRAVCGDTAVDSMFSFWTWLIFKPNPCIQIFYLVVAVGGFIIYVKVVFIKYCPGPYLASWHRITGSILMLACYYSFYKACTVDPGVIKDNK